MDRSRWDFFLIRACLIVLLAALGAFFRPFSLSLFSAIATGAAIGIGVCLLDLRLKSAELKSIITGSVGLFVGGLAALPFVPLIDRFPLPETGSVAFLRYTLPLGAGFIGLLVGLRRAHTLHSGSFESIVGGHSASSGKIVDTSVLIDGRICEVAESGFLEGELIVPRFVLHELQAIADSPDSVRRNRGRRGLDVVHQLQKFPGIHVEVSNTDFPDIREVDLKLIELAKQRRSKMITNDFNLNKLAQVQNLQVLNINELANALRPVALPGETMRVFILKEGKEYNQGVAYLNDGTMVVVDNARRMISKTVDVVVTSVLQTTAGKMIFGRYDERGTSASNSMSASATSSGPS